MSATSPTLLDSWASRLHPEEKDGVLQAFGAHLTDYTGRTPYDIEYRLQTKAQGYRWYHARGTTLRDAQGVPLRVAGSLVDITTEKSRLLQAQQIAETATASTEFTASTKFTASAEIISAGARHQTEQAAKNADSIADLVRSLTETSINAVQAAQTSHDAGATAEEGGRVVGKTIHGMNAIADIVSDAAAQVAELGQSSKRVGEIVGVIDSIAGQTNLLALNAAIEAARAGAQGRGFAVVADEVRKLAEHTASATKEIAAVITQIQNDTTQALNLIQRSKMEVEAGRDLAGQAEVSLSQIIKAAREVDEIIAQVAAASRQQLTTSKNLAESTEIINQITQTNERSIAEMAGHAAISKLLLV